MANPEGAKAREPYKKTLTKGGLCPESIKSLARSALPLATNGTQEGLARDLGSGSKPLLMKKGLGLMEKSEGLPSDGVLGYPLS